MKRLRPLMGTLCAIEAHGNESLTMSTLNAAFDVMSEIEHQLHPTRAHSEVSRLVENTGQNIEISAQIWDLLFLAQSIGHASGGVFDPCLPTRPGRLSDIELGQYRQVLVHVPVALDLGGIAKGFAVDRAIGVLREAGCVSAVVNAGGDTRVFGDEPQQMLLRADDETTLQVMLRNCALAVTDIAASNAPPEHRGYYNRRSNRHRVRDRAAIQAPSAAVADALTKCALYLSSSELESLLREYHAEILDW